MKQGMFRALTIAVALAGSQAYAAGTVKIALIDPLSGPFANVGESMLRHMQLAVEALNAKGGVLGGTKFELIALDSKSSPQEAQLALKQAIDRGATYINQTNGSNVAAALIDAVDKNNERNPDKRVVYLNTGAVDPALTNDKCSFWHFRFDADAEMKMAALTDAIITNPAVKKIYLINQDYAFGQSVAKAARANLTKKKPDIKIVGDELHPLGKIKDFSPYVAKIKASGADTVITGNWGNDMALLIKASRDAGFKPEFYTYYAGGLGTPTALGNAGVGHLRQVTQFHTNIGSDHATKLVMGYKDKFKDAKDDYYFSTHTIAIEMLARAMEQAKSTDPVKVARALENMKHNHAAGQVYMRADNHQLIQPLYTSTYVKVDGAGVKFDVERTGNGFKTDKRVEGKDTVLPTTCKMTRP